MIKKISSSKVYFAGLAVFLLIIFLHRILGNYIFSYAPLPLVLSVIITYSAENRMKFLVALCLISEIYTGFPPGIISLIIFTPWLVNKLTKKISPDLSFYFVGVIALAITLQLSIAFGYEFISMLANKQIAFFEIKNLLPFGTIFTIITVSSFISSIICITWREIFPIHDRQNVLS